MKKKFFSVLSVLGIIAIATNAFAAGNTIYVDGSVAGPGTGTIGDPFKSIQTAIDDAGTTDGDTISIADGTYTISATIEVSKELTIQGTSQAGTIIDASGATGPFGKFGIHSSKSNITFNDFTLTSPTGSQGRGFKIEGTSTNTSGAVQDGARSANVAINRVTVNGDGGIASRTGIDLNGINGVSLTDVTSQNNGGNGISFTDSSNISMTNVTTSGNKWGGVALYTKGQYYPGGISGVTITNLNASENNPLYNQNEGTFNTGSTPFATTGLTTSNPEFNFQGKNNTNSDFSTYVWFNNDQNELNSWISALPTVNASKTSITDSTTNTSVVSSGMSIQAAIDAAAPGATIVVGAGTYNEHLSITKSLTLQGANAGTYGSSTSRVTETILDGSGTDAPVFINADNVTIDGFTIQAGANGVYHSGVFMTLVNTGNAIKNNIITDNTIGVYAQCNDCTINRNLFDGNNRPGAAGGSAIYTENSVNLTIDDNEFKNHSDNSAIIFAAGAAGAHTGTAVTNNWIHDNNVNNSMIYVVGMTNGTFSGNTLSQLGSNVLTFSNANSTISITGNKLINSFRGIRIVDNGDLTGDSDMISVHNNQIYGNSTAGLEVISGYTGTVDAITNWWGDTSGPAGPGNLSGLGNIATGTVSFDPWCLNPDCTPVIPPTPTPTTSGGGIVAPAAQYYNGSTYVQGTQSTNAGSVNTTTGQVLGASTFKFLKNLFYGSRGDDVNELQKMLIAGGYLKLKTGLPTGWFGPMTRAALIKWQQDNKIVPANGYFGPISRNLLNK